MQIREEISFLEITIGKIYWKVHWAVVRGHLGLQIRRRVWIVPTRKKNPRFQIYFYFNRRLLWSLLGFFLCPTTQNSCFLKYFEVILTFSIIKFTTTSFFICQPVQYIMHSQTKNPLYVVITENGRTSKCSSLVKIT